MFRIVTRSTEWNGEIITLETGKIAKQADASVLVRMKDSVLIVNVTRSESMLDNVDYCPLVVQYIEKYYAAEKFPGGFLKREGKPLDREVLISRIIDRAIRPLFPEDCFYEINVTCNLLSYDCAVPSDIMAVIGVAAALKISSLPFDYTVAAVKLGMNAEGGLIINPSFEQTENIKFDLTLAGTQDSILMIELLANEMPEEMVIQAIEFGKQSMLPAIALIDEFYSACADAGCIKEKCFYEKLEIDDMYLRIQSDFGNEIKAACSISGKHDRKAMIKKCYDAAIDLYSSDDSFQERVFKLAFHSLQKNETYIIDILDN